MHRLHRELAPCSTSLWHRHETWETDRHEKIRNQTRLNTIRANRTLSTPDLPPRIDGLGGVIGRSRRHKLLIAELYGNRHTIGLPSPLCHTPPVAPAPVWPARLRLQTRLISPMLLLLEVAEAAGPLSPHNKRWFHPISPAANAPNSPPEVLALR